MRLANRLDFNKAQLIKNDIYCLYSIYDIFPKLNFNFEFTQKVDILSAYSLDYELHFDKLSNIEI